MKQLSVIVTVYNVEIYLKECLDSIVNQAYQDLDIVIVNDGSTDASGEIIDSYAQKDSRITVIHQENKGKLYSRYVGLVKSIGEYVTFVDGDDWIDPNTYLDLKKYMDLNEDVIMYQIIKYFNDAYQYVSNINYSEGLYTGMEIREKIKPSMIWNIPRGIFGLDPSLCNKIFKKEYILHSAQMASHMNLGYGDDVAILYPIFDRIKSFRIIYKAYYYHRQRERGVVADYLLDENFFQNIYQLYDYLLGYFRNDIGLRKQLDYFYVNSVNLGLAKYNENDSNTSCLFPFRNVPVNSKIILYGAGKIGRVYHRQVEDSQYCQIVNWVDAKASAYKDDRIRDIETIMTMTNYDYIVIAIKNKMVVEQVKKMLIIDYRIDKEIIIY